MDNKWLIETILDLIKVYGIIAGATWGIVNATNKFFRYREKKLEETSVGITKVREFEKDRFEVKQDIIHLKETDKQHFEELQKLDSKFERLMDKAWDILGKK